MIRTPRLVTAVALLGLLAGIGVATTARPDGPALACNGSPHCTGGPPPVHGLR